jgi:hypothetical protein
MPDAEGQSPCQRIATGFEFMRASEEIDDDLLRHILGIGLMREPLACERAHGRMHQTHDLLHRLSISVGEARHRCVQAHPFGTIQTLTSEAHQRLTLWSQLHASPQAHALPQPQPDMPHADAAPVHARAAAKGTIAMRTKKAAR